MVILRGQKTPVVIGAFIVIWSILNAHDVISNLNFPSQNQSSGNGPSIVNGSQREGERQPFAKYNAQIDEVLVIMQDNVNKVMERGEAMDNLDTRADNLQLHSNQFERHSRRVQNKLVF